MTGLETTHARRTGAEWSIPGLSGHHHGGHGGTMSLSVTARRIVTGFTVVVLAALGGATHFTAAGAAGRPDGASQDSHLRAPTPAVDNWTTYHYDQRRQGYDPYANPASGDLAIAWKAHLDGAVYAEPLIIDDTVIAVTENDSVYALTLSGSVIWKTHLGTPV